MKKILPVLVFSIINLVASAQLGVKTISLFNNKFNMTIPADVDTMSAKNIQIKYHKVKDEKSWYYADAGLDFSFVVAPVPGAEGVNEEDMIRHKDDLLAAFRGKGDKLEEDTILKVNNHNLIVVAFNSYVPGGKVFNRRFFAVAGGKLILVAFNAYGDDMEKRKLQIEQSINSVTIK